MDLDKDGVKKVCQQFVDWIRGVSMEDRAYMLLFLMGVHNTADNVRRFWKHGDKHWIRALIANPECANDPYILKKIRELIRERLRCGCMGEIWVDGNFQTMIMDPYAMMQYICGQHPDGLLGPGEFYDHYWNERGVRRVNVARSPQTYRCENVVADLVMTEETEKWYKHLYLGFVMNFHGHEVVNLGGADADNLSLSA